MKCLRCNKEATMTSPHISDMSEIDKSIEYQIDEFNKRRLEQQPLWCIDCWTVWWNQD